MLSERKIVQVSQTAAENGYTCMVLCDDGTVWEHAYPNGWVQFAPIPQDEEAPDAA